MLTFWFILICLQIHIMYVTHLWSNCEEICISFVFHWIFCQKLSPVYLQIIWKIKFSGCIRSVLKPIFLIWPITVQLNYFLFFLLWWNSILSLSLSRYISESRIPGSESIHIFTLNHTAKCLYHLYSYSQHMRANFPISTPTLAFRVFKCFFPLCYWGIIDFNWLLSFITKKG